MRRFIKLIVVCVVVALVSGCAVVRVNATHTPDAKIDQIQFIYVVHFKPDRRMISEIIADQLNDLGYSATTGEAADQPKGMDVVLTYEDRWMWDMTNYLIELKMWLEDPESGEFVAEGYSVRTSLARKSPDYMVTEVLQKLFLRE